MLKRTIVDAPDPLKLRTDKIQIVLCRCHGVPPCFSDAVIISACIQPVKAENRAGKRGGSVVRYAQTDKKEGVVLLYLGLLLLAGILQGVMVSLNGQMGNYFSLFGICFFVHAIALVLLLAYLLAKRQTLRFAGAPWYVYLVGVMGIAIVASSSWCTLHVGASAFMALSTAGQLISSALIDRFGLFGMPVTRIRKRQLPGYALVLLGVLLVVLN